MSERVAKCFLEKLIKDTKILTSTLIEFSRKKLQLLSVFVIHDKTENPLEYRSFKAL